jgi:cytochrome c556
MSRIGFVSIVFGLGILPIAAAQSANEYELVKLVENRKALMYDMQTAYLSLLSVKQGNNTDLASAADNARTISEKMGMFDEFLLPDTAAGQVSNSRARPEIWTEPEEFAAAVEALISATTLLSETALEGDIAAFNDQFDVVAAACGGCHGLLPSSGGPFRTAW